MGRDMSNPMGRPPKYKDSMEISKRCDEYFILCDKEDRPYTSPGLAIALGFNDRSSLDDYKSKKKFFPAIKKAIGIIERQRLEKMLKGGQNVAGCIFDLKNNFGYKDKMETEISGPGGGSIAITAYPPEPEALAKWETAIITARKARQLPEKT